MTEEYAIKTEHAALPAWRDPITDPPELGLRVILCVDNASVMEGWRNGKGEYCRYTDDIRIERIMNGKITGWMPMPKPQKETQ